MRFDKTLRLLALLVVAYGSHEAHEAHSAEPRQSWVRSAPPLAKSSRYTDSRNTSRYNEPKPLPDVAASNPRATGKEFDQRLTALELALSTIVAEQPNLWYFDPLETEAASLLMVASGEKERQAVRAIATRIDEFASIANRYRDTRGSLARVGHSRIAPTTRLTKAQDVPSLSAKEVTEVKQERSEAVALGFDAVGILRSVVSQRPDAPKFALVDGKGDVTTFLTPTPTLDLQPMLGKRIGVKGSRGFMPAYKREHLTANRVTALDTIRR